MTLTLKGVPAVWVPIEPPPAASTLKWSRPASFTVKVLEVPVFVPAWSVAVTVATDPDWVRVTEWEARTPEVNAADCTHPALHVLVEVTSTVPVNPVTVLLKVSWAVTLTLKGVPAVWVPMAPPEVSVTAKWSRPLKVAVMAESLLRGIVPLDEGQGLE